MLRFNISINGGSEVEINEPVGFDKVDFNLTRSEDLHSISSSFAGNSIEFEFNKDVHYNVFENIISAYELKGFLADVKLYIYWDNLTIFVGEFDFSTTQTDMLNYIKCQIVKKDKLYLLDKNKGVAVDLLSDKDLDKNTVATAPVSTLSLPPVELFKESFWEDQEVKDYFVLLDGVNFNNAQNTTKYEINNTLSWMSFSEPQAGKGGRNFQLVSAKDNLKGVDISIEYEVGTYFQMLGSGGGAQMQLWLYYGEERPDLNNGDWETQVNKVNLTNITLSNYPQTFPLPSLLTYNIPSLPRGSGIWLFWRSVTQGALLHNNGTKITINGTSTNFYSLTNSVSYKELVKNAVKKVANINNVIWNINYYNDTYAFNGNLLRQIEDKGFDIKWQDIQKQLNERNLGAYYNETTDTLVIDHRNNILGNNNLGTFGDYAKKDFYFVTEDENFIVNSFKYKYSKFQAQKEENINGNNASVHGESEWYVANKTFEGSIDVDLPFVRDSFMIEDIRQKALVYKDDTATNEDSTVVLVETRLNSPSLTVKETINVNASWDDPFQSFQNDGSFSWLRLGIDTINAVYVNGVQYYVSGTITNNRLTLSALGFTPPPLNGLQTITISYTVLADRIALLSNGLLNQSFSVRQNILYWQSTLGVANYYNQSPILNTLYKEDKGAVINGLQETAPIIALNPIHKSRVIDTKVLISVEDYFYLANNKIGYINIYNSKDEIISIYLKELKTLFLNGCDQMEATLKGWLVNEVDIPPVTLSLIITRATIDDVFYPSLNFIFNDTTQRIIIMNGINVLYSNLNYTQICAPNECFSTYTGTKNYLLSL